jgi:hypothetical protein
MRVRLTLILLLNFRLTPSLTVGLLLGVPSLTVGLLIQEPSVMVNFMSSSFSESFWPSLL